MPVSFHYKGLSPEDRICSLTPEKSVVKARGTLYEAWFDTLQASPWYLKVAEGGEVENWLVKETWEKFGDLRAKTFGDWWLQTGYKIFAEQVPYEPMHVADLRLSVTPQKGENNPPMLTIEVPLNLSPAALQEQFNKILRQQREYMDEYDRWNHSTALVHQHRESKLNYETIKKWLTVFKEYEERKYEPGFKLYNFTRELKLHPTMFKGLPSKHLVPEDLKVPAANVASNILKSVRNLMANATEMQFPDTTEHRWAVSGRRSKGGEGE
jgi:hypothetical protein